MNSMVHNTAWIHGHFHLTLGTTVALSFMGGTYWMLPRMLGRELRLMPLARIQPYLWILGMALFSISYHIAGLRGMPRRVYSGSLTGDYGGQWHGLTQIAAVGAVILLISALSFVVVTVATWFGARQAKALPFEFAVPLRPPVYSLWDRFGFWVTLAAALVIVAYGIPITQLLLHPRFGSPPYKPF